ncbi:MAG: MmgE/PrpD family protein [Betaproteobacteria bacterium]|nr:MmgE/PrpD family protein [Betaproteobacteria bacterium]
MRELCAYIAGALKQPLPAEVAETGKHHLADTLAAIVSGSRLLPGRKAIAYVKSLGGVKEATVAGTRLTTSCVNAAFANGMMAHADETDDSHTRSQSHPGCGAVPAALALAERGKRDGRAMLRAVVLGYDICTRANLALGPLAFRAAGRSSHSFGPLFGAAAAAGALAGLRERQVPYLLSYTAQQASGVNCWMRDREHVEKAFDFGGMPSRNGVTAATLAAGGFTGVEDVFSGDKNFFFAYAAEPDPGALTRGLGSTFEVVNTSIKRWPVGFPIQAALDALSAIIKEHRIAADDVGKLTVTIHKSGAATVNDRSIPDINIQHLLSVMLLDGTVTFKSSHDRRRMRDPKALAVKRRIELIGDEALERAPTRQAIVELRTRDGRILRQHTRAVRGTPANPMTRQEVDAKCHDLMAPVLGQARARRLLDTVWSIEKVRDMRSFRLLLRA